jgi:hypothetical protein
MSKTIGKLLLLCAALTAMGALATSSAMAAASDPLFVVVPEKPTDPKATKTPPPAGYFEGPCGLAVSSTGDFYISDYYHDAIDAYGPASGSAVFKSQIPNVEALDGPCGLAFSSTDSLYVNNFHRNVVNLTAGTPLALPSEDTAHHVPTGVAVDSATNNVYVDNRTYLTVFNSSGAQLMEGLEPLKIGVGNIGSGYGLAVSSFSGTAGRVYVPDATTNTVKVFDPSLSKTTPLTTIHGPGKGFNSLRDSAIAIDRANGNIYVVDNLQPTFTEEPEAVVDVFNSSGSLLGVLKYKIYDALSPGIAVDNSAGSTQGRVYVTSGNTDKAGIYAYGPGAQTNGFLPPTVGLTVKTRGSGAGTVRSVAAGIACSGTCSSQPLAGSAVTLTAAPNSDSTFTGWSGGCSGTQACTVTMSEAASVEASFQVSSTPGEAASTTTSPAPPTSPAASLDAPSRGPAKAHHWHRRRHGHRHRGGHRR